MLPFKLTDRENDSSEKGALSQQNLHLEENASYLKKLVNTGIWKITAFNLFGEFVGSEIAIM